MSPLYRAGGENDIVHWAMMAFGVFMIGLSIAVSYLAISTVFDARKSHAQYHADNAAGLALWMRECKLDEGACFHQWDRSGSLKSTYIAKSKGY